MKEYSKQNEVSKRDRLLKGVKINGIDYLHVGAKEMAHRIIELGEYIRESGEQINHIAFLATGGSAVAKGVKDSLGKIVDGYSMIWVSSYNKFESGEIIIKGDFPARTKEEIKGKRVVLVDDLVDSGKTIIFTKKYLEDLGAGKVTTAVLFRKPRSTFKPDFYTGTTEAWIVLAHEYNEFIKDFYDAQSSKEVPYEEIKRNLEKIGIPREIIRIYMPLMTRSGLVV